MRTVILMASLLVAAAAGCDQAKNLHGADLHKTSPHTPAAAHAEQSDSVTVDIQGGYDAWRKSPYIQQYYDLTKASFADGADKVDFAGYQEKSYAIFRAFGGASGGKEGEEAMLDHLKDIPRQMVSIVKEDPSVLESYDKFWIALSGPP